MMRTKNRIEGEVPAKEETPAAVSVAPPQVSSPRKSGKVRQQRESGTFDRIGWISSTSQ